MKLLFSEATPDYGSYLFPYVIWAVPEKEQPWEMFQAGFLPGAPDLSRFYLCRQLRVELRNFQASSENRRILRKGEGLRVRLIPRTEFQYTEERAAFFMNFAAERFGAGVMSRQRLDLLFQSPVISHVLIFDDPLTGREVGTAVLFVSSPRMAFYYYAFYDLQSPRPNLGMFMMTAAVDYFAREGFERLYLGTCYSERALYKTQFPGVEFFNGFRWSPNMDELKFALRRIDPKKHLLENDDFRAQFYGGSISNLAALGSFEIDKTNKSPGGI